MFHSSLTAFSQIYFENGAILVIRKLLLFAEVGLARLQSYLRAEIHSL
jgi:hypothetical protein